MFKNVASQTWTVLAFDKSDGSRVIGDAANITCKVSADDGTAAALGDVNPTEVEDGKYRFDMTQGESNADKLEMFAESSTADVIVIGLPEVIYTRPQYFSDMTIESNGELKVDVEKINGSAQTADDLQDAIDVGYDTVSHKWEGVKVVDTTTTNTDMRGTDGANTTTPPTTAAIWAHAGRTLTGAANITSDGSAITMQSSGVIGTVNLVNTTTTNTDMRGTDGANTTTPPTEAAIWAHAGRTLTAATNITSDGSAITMQSTGVIGTVNLVNTTTTNTDMRGTDGANTTTPPTAGAVADAVWDELASGHTTAGTYGFYLDAQVSGIGGGSLTAEGIADAVWDETMTDHLNGGSTGAKLNGAAAAGDPWGTAVPGSYVSGEAGYILGKIQELLWTHPHRALTTTMPGDSIPENPTEFTLYIGDDYTTANGRNLTWKIPTPPDATGGTATISLQKFTSSTPELENHACGIVNPATANQAISAQFLSAVTGALTAGAYRFTVKLTLATSEVVTVATGVTNVQESI